MRVPSGFFGVSLRVVLIRHKSTYGPCKRGIPGHGSYGKGTKGAPSREWRKGSVTSLESHSYSERD